MHDRSIKAYLLSLLLGVFIITGCRQQANPATEETVPELVIFTSQEAAVYKPIIKEFQERSGVAVRVISGSFQDLQEMIADDSLNDTCDVVFGIPFAALETNQECWDPYVSEAAAFLAGDFVSAAGTWTPFSAVPMVIMYNTKVVTYREVPDDWRSLLEPRWQGRIALIDPRLSDLHATALAVAMDTADEPITYIEHLTANLDYYTYDSLAEVNQAVSDGRCSVGLTLETAAELLRQETDDIDYIYPDSGTCLYLDGSAIVAGCQNTGAARSFLDFTVHVDAQRILVTNLNRRSVRTDIAPPSGLKPISQLNIYTIEPEQLAAARTLVLDEWRFLMDTHQNEGR